ncbi:MAG: mechanosensitive ion channel [Mogibacterium sp.]|nr:mechanosensitive ion channel [Mogibacterium sp.]
MSENKEEPNMVKGTKKTDLTGNALLACIIAAVLIICIQIAGTYLNLQSFLKRETSFPSLESGIRSSIEQLSFSIDSQSEKDKKDALADTYFRALALRDRMGSSDFLDSTVEDYGKTYVVRVKDGKLIAPDEAEVLPGITADALKGEQGIIDTSRDLDWRCFTAYSSIGNGYYAMQEVNASDGSDNLASIALCEIETAFDGKAILLDENGRFVYYNSELNIPAFHNDNGLDEEALNKFLKKHEPYYVMARSADERYTLVLVLSKYEILSDFLSVDLLVALVALILSLVLIVWITEVKRLLKSGKADKHKISDYEPLHFKRRIRTFSILAVVLVLLAGMFSSAIGSLYSVTWDAQNTLTAVEQLSEDSRFVTEFRIEEMKDNDAEHARIIADAIYRDPKLRTKKQLGAYKDMLSANYIMLYDSEGREFLTDSPYINMSIGGLSSSDMHAFRRVLNGGAEAYLENVTDNVTGGKSNLVGVRMPSISGDSDGGYNLLVISFPPSAKRGISFFESSDEMVASLVSSYNGFMLLDKDKKIRFISNKPLYGRDPLELGMQEDEVRDNFLGEFELDNDHYYGASNEMNGELFYYTAKSSVLRNGMFAFGLLEAVGFMLVLMVILRILMKDYDLIYDESTAEEYTQPDPENTGRSWISRFPWLKRANSPEARARAVLNITAGLCILIVGVLAITSANADPNDNLIPYIFSDNWNRGINLFAAARVIFMICGVAVIWSAISFIVGIAVDFLDARGASVVRLIKSVLSYAVVLIVLYYSALYLGFDPATLLASVGIIGLAISLGVKDIVADVFSGVSLIFEKAFQVGDIVEIDGTIRGTVQELGVRTLKLFGDDNNLKVVRYSDIHKVNNLSRSNSWCLAEFTVKNNVDTGELRKMLWTELPEIHERHREILSDPVFTGISSINTGSITFGVKAECKESKMRKVRSILNYEIRDMLRRNDVDLL